MASFRAFFDPSRTNHPSKPLHAFGTGEVFRRISSISRQTLRDYTRPICAIVPHWGLIIARNG
jgi:hypothetical protein